MDCLGLEPSACLSKFVGNNSNTVKIRIILINLVIRISPSISNCYSFQNNLSLIQKCLVVDNSLRKSRNVVSCKRFSCNVKGTLFQSRPLLIKIVEEIQQMFRSLTRWANQSLGLISRIRKANADRLINEDSVADYVPRISDFADFIFGDFDGTILGESTKLRTRSWSSL